MVNHHRDHVAKDDNDDEDFKSRVVREIEEPHPYLVLIETTKNDIIN